MQLDLVSERLEESPGKVLTSPGCDHWKVNSERNRGVRELLPLLASSSHRSREHATHCDAQKRIRGIGPIVDILLKLATLPSRAATSHQSYRIHLDQQSRRAALRGRLRVEHVAP